jgi:hypothetical protein
MKQFTKHNLKTGMSVELKNGTQGRVIENIKVKNLNPRPFVIFLFNNEYEISDNYDSELRYNGENEGYDIEKVFNVENDENIINKNITKEIIWKRDKIEAIIRVNGVIKYIYILSKEDLNYIENELEELKINK